VLKVPRYDFNWQVGYDTDVKVPKGSKMTVDAHFDNSPNNNSIPTQPAVYYGIKPGRDDSRFRHRCGYQAGS